MYHGHRHLEKVYENALAQRLRLAGLDVKLQQLIRFYVLISAFFAFCRAPFPSPALSTGFVFLPTPLIRPIGQPNLGLAILPLPQAKDLGEIPALTANPRLDW